MLPSSHGPGRGQRLAPWGDGLAELSLSTLLYAHSWKGVDDDELVFYLPSLHRPQALRELPRHQGPLPVLAQALRSARQRRDISASRWLVRAVDDARWLYAGGTMQPPASTREDAVMISLLSGINAIYIYPGLLDMADTLTAAAWLAVPLQGRSAILPPSVALRLHEALQAASNTTDVHDAAYCDRLLKECAVQCFGRRRIYRACGIVTHLADPRLISPRHRWVIGLSRVLDRQAQWLPRSCRPEGQTYRMAKAQRVQP